MNTGNEKNLPDFIVSAFGLAGWRFAVAVVLERKQKALMYINICKHVKVQGQEPPIIRN